MNQPAVTFEVFKNKINDYLENNNFNSQIQGAKLEKLIQIIINAHPLGDECVKVDTFQNYISQMNKKTRQHESAKDHGIDLIGYDSSDNVIPIQAKNYLKANQIKREEVDKFFTEITTKSNKYNWNPVTAWFVYNGVLNKRAEERLVEINNLKDTNIKKIAVQELLRKIYYQHKIHDLKELYIDKWLESVTAEKVKTPKTLRAYQTEALDKADQYYKDYDRGHMVMACGTGKTLTSLAMIEKITPPNGMILFLVPTLDLMRQSIEVARNDVDFDFEGFAVCSDTSVIKRTAKKNDEIMLSNADLPINKVFSSVEQINDYYKKIIPPPPILSQRIIVFSTYQSVDKIIKAQKIGFGIFDLVIYDEAHRTVKFIDGQENNKREQNFVVVHDNEQLRSKKRLYMTATPKIFKGDTKKIKESNETDDVIFLDMSQEDVFGKQFFTYSFTQGVTENYLADFKVVILTFLEDEYNTTYQQLKEKYEKLQYKQKFIELDEFTKLYGVYKTLKSRNIKNAINFCQRAITGKANSRLLTIIWEMLIEHIQQNQEDHNNFKVDFRHVDGTMNSQLRRKNIDALREKENDCVVLSNARCLTEGVDVPSLDAVIFMQPRQSEIDIVQATGRVMRKTKDKHAGLVIVPVVASIADNKKQELEFNFEKTAFKKVGDILGALRSPNVKPELKQTVENHQLGDSWNNHLIEVTTEIDEKQLLAILKARQQNLLEDNRQLDTETIHSLNEHEAERVAKQLKIELTMENIQNLKDQLMDKVKSAVVKRVGTRSYWVVWTAEKLPRIVKNVKNFLQYSYEENKEIWEQVIKQVRSYLNPAITKQDAINWAADSFITQPLFAILFPQSLKHNPVVKIFSKLEDDLNLRKKLSSEEAKLQNFYDNIRKEVATIETQQAKQNLLKMIYEKYLTAVYKEEAKNNGVVYTPIEIVDFMLKGVNYLLKTEFNNASFNSKNVKVLEPFAGTGSFINRLLSEDLNLIEKKNLEYKYKHDIYANEIMLLPYYIASINISETFNNRQNNNFYIPYDNIIWTDTFELLDKNTNQTELQLTEDQNHEKIAKLKNELINVIISNPPYSVGEKNKNIHKTITENIFKILTLNTKSKSKGVLQDSIIKAFLFSIQKIKLSKENGILAFIVSNSFLANNATDSLRNYFHRVFSKFYIIDLKGNGRKTIKNKILFSDEGESIFEGKMVGTCILFGIIKNQAYNTNNAYYVSCKKILKRKEKLKWITKNNLEKFKLEKVIKSLSLDANNDWFQKNMIWKNNMISLNFKINMNKNVILRIKSNGIMFYNQNSFNNFSKNQLIKNVKEEIGKYKLILNNASKSAINKYPNHLKKTLNNYKKPEAFQENYINIVHNVPFVKKYSYYDNFFPAGLGKFKKIFSLKKESPNIIINFHITPFAVKTIVNYDFLRSLQKPNNFPRFEYNISDQNRSLFNNRQSCISNYGREIFFSKELQNNPEQDDIIFAYIYGFLHYDSYLKKYYNNFLKGEIPRIYKPRHYADFYKISEVGQQLLDLHTNYENQLIYQDIRFLKGDWDLEETKYYIKKMKFAKDKKGEKDKTTIIFNDHITITNIPLQVYDWTLSDVSAVEHVMKGYVLDVKNNQNPNDFCAEINNPRYIFELLLRVIYISLKTLELKKALPAYETMEWDDLQEN